MTNCNRCWLRVQLAEGIPDFRCGEIPSYTQFGSLDGSFSELEAVAMHPALTILVTDKLDVISLCPQSVGIFIPIKERH